MLNCIEWHEECLKNIKESYKKEKEAYKRAQEQLDRNYKDIKIKEYQIECAKKEKKINFDDSKYKIIKKVKNG